MVKAITRVLRRPRPKNPRHRIGVYQPVQRTHPWFEQRARRTAELGSYR